MSTDVGTTVGELFCRLRKLAGLNMAEAAQKLDVAVTSISDIENDQYISARPNVPLAEQKPSEPAVTSVETRRLYESGYSCSCHISPPCGFCMSMTEEEANAHSDGMDALVALWNKQDEQEKES